MTSGEVKGLLERVEASTGPDREIDGAIMAAVLGAEIWTVRDNDHIDAQIRNRIWKGRREDHVDYLAEGDEISEWRYRIEGNPIERGEVPKLTASIDAALALVERCIPNACALMALSPEASICNISTGPLGTVPNLWFDQARAPTPALAILAALLRARHGPADRGSRT